MMAAYNLINLPQGRLLVELPKPFDYEVNFYSDSETQYIRILCPEGSTVCTIDDITNPKALGEDIARLMTMCHQAGYQQGLRQEIE